MHKENAVPSGEVTATGIVPLAPDDAFLAFTDEIDSWWVRTRARGSVISFEGGRLIETSEVGADEIAVVSEWKPPSRIELAWSGPHSEPGDRVVVDFTRERNGTRITIRHRRPGIERAAATSAIIGLWWGDFLSRFQRR